LLKAESNSYSMEQTQQILTAQVVELNIKLQAAFMELDMYRKSDHLPATRKRLSSEYREVQSARV
jgi:hypothetical protein